MMPSFNASSAVMNQSFFSYFLTTDYDFRQDVLSYGKEVEVLEPESFRKSISATASDIADIYK